jgi:hypothetical protein
MRRRGCITVLSTECPKDVEGDLSCAMPKTKIFEKYHSPLLNLAQHKVECGPFLSVRPNG